MDDVVSKPEPILISGYTRDEIISNLSYELTVATKREVRIELLHRQRNMRNKPCPCGSGKKFKHCCQSIGEVVRASKIEL